MNKQLAALAASLLAPALASAQVTYGTDDVSASDNFFLDIGTGTSTGPVFTGSEAWGIADDAANGVEYANDGANLSSYPAGMSGVAVTSVGTIVDAGGATQSMTGLAFDNGVLYGHRNVSTEGLYSIDLVTLEATLLTTYATTSIDLGGLDFDPATGLLYGSNDGSAYTDPQGNSGRGVVVIDVNTLAESLDFPYPPGETDIDGLAFDPVTNAIYLLEDEPAPLHRYDIAAMAFDANPPMNAIAASEVFSAGTYSGGGTGGVGTNYCTAVANSSGAAGVISAMGSASAAANNLTLVASNLPANQFGIFVVASTQGFVPGAGGTSNGNLCLAGALGRFVGPGQILDAGASGEFSLALDLTAIPQGAGTVAVMAGETWNFQAWHRDQVGLGSNFTDGLQIDFN